MPLMTNGFNLSYWERDIVDCDVLIVGAGFLGAWTAYRLASKHPGLNITVVERSHMSYGASIRNAGFATSGSITEILADEEKYGTEAAFEIVRQRRRGIVKINDMLSGYSSMGMDLCGGFEKFTPENADRILHNIGRINSAIGGFELREDGVFVEDDGLLDSYKLLRTLHGLCDHYNVKFLFGAEVVNQPMFDSPYGLVATTIQSGGGRILKIYSEKLLVCANGFTHKILPDTEITPQRNHVIVTSPLKQLIPKMGFHAEEGFVYWRPVYDDNGDQRLLCGGMRQMSLSTENTSDFEMNDTIITWIVKYIDDNITTDYDVDFKWTGIMGFTPNKQNLLEQHGDNIFAACCCNGQGVAMAPVFSQEIVEKLFP